MSCLWGGGTWGSQLKYGKKIVYMRQRIWLPWAHQFCRQHKTFNGKSKEKRASTAITGDEVQEIVKDVNVEFGKGSTSGNGDTKWKKQYIFFELPYWRTLYV